MAVQHSMPQLDSLEPHNDERISNNCNYLTSQTTVLHKKLRVAQLIEKSSAFMKPKVYYHVNNSSTLVPVLSQNSSHTLIIVFFRSPLILPFCLFLCRPLFSDQTFACISQSPNACYMPCPSFPPGFSHPNNAWCTVKIMNLPIKILI